MARHLETLEGLYISQFLARPVQTVSTVFEQRYRTPLPANDFLTTIGEWLQIQGGVPPWREYAWDATPRYIRNGRDLAEWVHYDFLFQAFLNAALILMNYRPEATLFENRAVFSEMNPLQALEGAGWLCDVRLGAGGGLAGPGDDGGELVAVRRVSRDLLKAEIFVLPGAVINHVRFSYAEERSDLRNAYHMHLEVAEHLVGLPGHLVTLDTPAFSEKDHPAFFLRNGHRLFVATRKPVDRSIGKCQSKQCKGNFACVKFRLLP